MRTWSAVVLALAGFSSWSCSDEAAGPGVGPDTSWQVFCSDMDEDMCGSSLGAHGPLAGLDDDPTVKYDDVKLKVSCSKSGAGLNIKIEDPGRKEADPDDPNGRTWKASVLEITNGRPDENKCFVKLTETRDTLYNLQESCANTKSSSEGGCEFTGEEDSNGYAFEGTLSCPGMHVGNSTPRPFRLGAARNPNEPIKLQILSCD